MVKVWIADDAPQMLQRSRRFVETELVNNLCRMMTNDVQVDCTCNNNQSDRISNL